MHVRVDAAILLFTRPIASEGLATHSVGGVPELLGVHVQRLVEEFARAGPSRRGCRCGGENHKRMPVRLFGRIGHTLGTHRREPPTMFVVVKTSSERVKAVIHQGCRPWPSRQSRERIGVRHAARDPQFHALGGVKVALLIKPPKATCRHFARHTKVEQAVRFRFKPAVV